ncbi:MAG: transporter substrate-binding domain-containing protein [Alphaproteobacteria bacterium]|nr:transporter substrate-binding domain-containing protein [Alphaproteobacteria bacterium]
MLRRLLAATACVAALAVAGTAEAKDWSKIKIATEGAYAPWNFTNSAGKLEGFEVDLANDLCKRMKATCEIVAQDWDGIIPALQAGKYDAIIAGMSITAKRKEVINFSAPYASTPAALAVLKTSPLAKIPVDKNYDLDKNKAEAEKQIATLKAALKGKALGAQVSTTHMNFLETYFKDVADVRSYKTTEQHDLDLTAGRIEGAYASIGYWKPMLGKPEGKDLVVVGPTFTGGVFGAGVGAGLRKADDDLRKLFDDAIAAAAADGTIKKLSVQWFGFDITPPM